MSPHEIKVLDQVQKEVSQNQSRFRSRLSGSEPQLLSRRALHAAGGMIPASGLSSRVHAIQTDQRLIQPHHVKERKSLTINTELANAATIRSVPLSIQTDGDSSESAVIDPRLVSWVRSIWIHAHTTRSTSVKIRLTGLVAILLYVIVCEVQQCIRL